MSPDCLLRWTALCVVLSMLCSSAAGQTINVLFLGNSYTSTGGLPSVFQQLAQAGGHTGVAGGASACALFGAHSGSFDICSVFSLSLFPVLFAANNQSLSTRTHPADWRWARRSPARSGTLRIRRRWRASIRAAGTTWCCRTRAICRRYDGCSFFWCVLSRVVPVFFSVFLLGLLLRNSR